jgi:uncharacterized protein
MALSQLEDLYNLKQKGIITDTEYEQVKHKILFVAANDGYDNTPALQQKNWGMNTQSYLLIMHLAQLVPTFGWLVSIAMWVLNKDKDGEVNTHGKMITNWIISICIYGFVFALLTIVVIGFPLLIALGICCLVFPIIGAIKAANGQYWAYPFSMNLIK